MYAISYHLYTSYDNDTEIIFFKTKKEALEAFNRYVDEHITFVNNNLLEENEKIKKSSIRALKKWHYPLKEKEPIFKYATKPYKAACFASLEEIDAIRGEEYTSIYLFNIETNKFYMIQD